MPLTERKVWRARQSVHGYPYKVPVGAEVEVVRNFPRKRVLVRYQGELILTLQGCLRRQLKENDNGRQNETDGN